MTSTPSIISLHQVSLGYRQHKTRSLLVRELDLAVPAKQLIALVGPNGVGKSTLLRAIAGMQKPLSGKITLFDRHLYSLSAKDRARHLSIVLTGHNEIGYMKASELVAMGRYPHTSWLGTFTASDQSKVESAIHLTSIELLLEKPLYQLSDGERQKVMIARALAQDTSIMILDEPTTHLDVTNRVSIVELLRQLVRTNEKTIIFSTHDIELALQVADRLWLMHDHTVTDGVPEDLVINGLLSAALSNEQAPFDLQSGTFRIRQFTTRPISLTGRGTAAIWTKRALERNGYSVIPDSSVKVEIISGKEWKIYIENQLISSAKAIEDLLQQLPNLDLYKTFYKQQR